MASPVLLAETICLRRIAISLLTLSAIIAVSSAYKVLLIPMQHPSHIVSMMTIADELDRRGHDVHVFQSQPFVKFYQSKNETNRIKYFIFPLDKAFAAAVRNETKSGDELMDDFARTLLRTRATVWDMFELLRSKKSSPCTFYDWYNEEIFNELNKERFDVSVTDSPVYMSCFNLIPHRLGVPSISYADFPAPWNMRVPWLPSFVPNQLSMFTERMSFSQRLSNTLLTMYIKLHDPQISMASDNLLATYRQYGHFETLEELMTKSVLFLITSDSVLDYARPTMPNVVEIGGLTTVEPNIDLLPPDMKNFMDGSEKGVVVVSFGSMLSRYPRALVDKFASAFRHLDGYRVVWRLNNTESVELSNNIMIFSWLPQNDALGHPKTKLFITHCGNNGQYEAVYHKVPMIGFPFHLDQPYNAQRMQYKGYGIAMNIHDFSSDELLSNIGKVLNDPSYGARVSRASEIFKSTLQRPAQRAAQWIEHICRFGGDHLRSPSNDLPLYQYLMIDILIVTSLFFIFVFGVLYLLASIMFRKVFRFIKGLSKTSYKND